MGALTAADVTAIVPALNEAASIEAVVQGLLARGIGRVVVADGGSGDGTADLASRAGASVLEERRRGYGNACLAGVAAAGAAPVLLFLDGDGAEDLDGALALVRCLIDGRAQLALGARLTPPGDGATQTVLAVFGNRLCSWWLRRVFRAPVSDLSSMKAITREAYRQLHPDHRLYGWTAQLITRAARHRVRIVEIPVHHHRRLGRSKVSGSLRGAFQAGCQMLAVLAQETTAALADALIVRFRDRRAGDGRQAASPRRGER